jgi:hypothetical protein
MDAPIYKANPSKDQRNIASCAPKVSVLLGRHLLAMATSRAHRCNPESSIRLVDIAGSHQRRAWDSMSSAGLSSNVTDT